jgi:glycosyltransferase involved in cell wall biosynthesis
MDRHMKNIISIVTPSFNQGVFLEDTIQSVLSQEGKFYIDYIIMDGDSKDDSVKIIKKYEKLLVQNCEIKNIDGLAFYINKQDNFSYNKCSGISYRWKSEKDRGQAHAINKGFAIAVGSTYAFLNSDDRYEESAFETVTRLFREKENTDIIYGNAFYIDRNNKIISMYRTQDINEHNIYNSCFICQPSLFLSRDIYKKTGNFNEKIHNSFDYEYWLRLKKIGAHYLNICNVLASSRVHTKTKTLRNRKEIYLEIFCLLLHYENIRNRSWMYQFTMEFWVISRFLKNCRNIFIKMHKGLALIYSKRFPNKYRKIIQEKYGQIFK